MQSRPDRFRPAGTSVVFPSEVFTWRQDTVFMLMQKPLHKQRACLPIFSKTR
mgnify:CR=1 FL=1